MKYKWKTHGWWTYNHLVSEKEAYCFDRPINIENFIAVNYDKNKLDCIECQKYKEKVHTYANGPNVLHINRKIFI